MHSVQDSIVQVMSKKLVLFSLCVTESLYSSETKYDSGSGWPSFYKALEAQGSLESVERKPDISHGMVRVEVVCRKVT